MATITRQQLTDSIAPEELDDDEAMAKFQRTKAWLFVAWCQNDLIVLTDPFIAQVRAAFPARGWPATRKNIEALLASAGA